MGAVTHCVLAQMRGKGGDRISAGIGYAYRRDGKGGYVAESHIFGSAEAVKEDLIRKVREMERIRGVELEDPVIISETIDVPEGQYGCCLASLVFTGYQE